MKLLFFIPALLFAARDISAQGVVSMFEKEDAEFRTFYGGLAAGANFSQVDGDGFAGYRKIGVYAGPLVYVRLNRLFLGAVSIAYSQKGAKARFLAESPYTGTTPEGYDLNLNYAEISVGVYHPFTMRPRVSVGAGLLYARLLSSKEEAFTNGPVNLAPEINYFHKDDLGVWLDLAYEWSEGWLIGLRYSRSLKTIRDAARIPLGYGGGLSAGQVNNVMSLRITYFFRPRATGS